jgi:hypothetical protein
LRIFPVMVQGGENGAAAIAGYLDDSEHWQQVLHDEMPKGDEKVSNEMPGARNCGRAGAAPATGWKRMSFQNTPWKRSNRPCRPAKTSHNSS